MQMQREANRWHMDAWCSLSPYGEQCMKKSEDDQREEDVPHLIGNIRYYRSLTIHHSSRLAFPCESMEAPL